MYRSVHCTSYLGQFPPCSLKGSCNLQPTKPQASLLYTQHTLLIVIQRAHQQSCNHHPGSPKNLHQTAMKYNARHTTQAWKIFRVETKCSQIEVPGDPSGIQTLWAWLTQTPLNYMANLFSSFFFLVLPWRAQSMFGAESWVMTFTFLITFPCCYLKPMGLGGQEASQEEILPIGYRPGLWGQATLSANSVSSICQFSDFEPILELP